MMQSVDQSRGRVGGEYVSRAAIFPLGGGCSCYMLIR